MHIYKICI